MILEYKTLGIGTLCSKSLGYQRIETSDECEFAAKTLRKSGKAPNVIFSEYYPSGCFFDLDEKIVYFNNIYQGMDDPRCSPICRRQGTSKLLQNI